MSNYEKVKIWREANRKLCPGKCGETVAWDTILCRLCTGKARTEKALNQTIAEVKNSKKSRWTHHIRFFSGKIKFQACAICGYTNHVETCHIKPVSSFSDESTIKEVNNIKNLIGLCPNHHWELDNGFIDLPAWCSGSHDSLIRS